MLDALSSWGFHQCKAQSSGLNNEYVPQINSPTQHSTTTLLRHSKAGEIQQDECGDPRTPPEITRVKRKDVLSLKLSQSSSSHRYDYEFM